MEHLPPEMVEYLLGFLSLDEVSESIRPLNRRFNALASAHLRRTLTILGLKYAKIIADLEQM
jgi:phage-related minor tail protein